MNKTFYLNSIIDEKSLTTENKELKIAGYANTVDKDRTRDKVLPSAWAKGIDNYRVNPILLFQHKHDQPIGKVDKITVDEKGIFVNATISEAAETQYSVHTLVRDRVLKAFSVGFLVKDQEYDADSDTSTITGVELLEISVVSVPANQTSLFSIRKSFDTDEEYQEYTSQFSKDVEEESEEKILVAGITSKDSGHYHAYEVDENGSGVTTYTSHGHGMHAHRVAEGDVEEINDHVHGLEVSDVIEGKDVEDSILDVTAEELDIDIDLASKSWEKPIVFDVPKQESEEIISVTEKELEEELEPISEEEEDLELEDPMIPIPFENHLSVDTSRINNGDFVSYNDSRYVVTKIATRDNPNFLFKEVDLEGNSKEESIKVLATSLSIVNDWDIGSGYDLALTDYYSSEELTNNDRDEITKEYKALVNLSEFDLYTLKQEDNIKENTTHQAKLNKILNLKSTGIENWNDTCYTIARNTCNMIKNLKALNRGEAETILALMLHGHKVEADNSEERKDMTTQSVGEIQLPKVEKIETIEQSPDTVVTPTVKVAEPEVAQLVEKTGESIVSDASRDEVSEQTKELLNELRAAREQVSALQTSKMQHEQSQRTVQQFTKEEMADAYLMAKAFGKKDDDSIFDTKIGAKMKAVTTVDAFLTNFSNNIQHEMEQELVIAPLFNKISVDAKNFHVPVADEDTDGDVAQYASGTFTTSTYDTSNVPVTNQQTISSVNFTPHKFMAMTHLAKDEEEDTILPIMGFLRAAAARRLARAIDKAILRGRGNLSGFTASPTNAITSGTGYASVIEGLTNLCEDASLTTDTASSSTKATPTNIATARSQMGKYGLRVNGNDLVYITSVEGYNELVQTADFRTVDTFGPQATYHTGTVGAIWGIPVIMSEFMDAVATTAHLGVIVYKPGFLVAERRGILVETEYEPRQQSTAIYMSTRFDFHALTTVSNAALSSTYSMAALIQAAA
tara:strand:+ start:2606 stop:5503 length:2898 start_codon:yes stop_codon:yes gene_type:complete